MREWQVKRRERTRQLIELGGLVVKADLVELMDDDRAALYGAFLTVAAKLCWPDGEQALVLFRRKGKRAFEAEQEAESSR
ncbi:conjugal transfer protein TraD [Pseudopontixanthobacter vadosimaris]|uniref:conjugal transfer protein TraD n=1 Tax=Pseudopontixanthobacter vadosimaris TaxID=2726450 RepID=UPI001473E9C9|nr:conjugal transfer protein TraD [Pseudopontixanthobacter vadosimaris]